MIKIFISLIIKQNKQPMFWCIFIILFTFHDSMHPSSPITDVHFSATICCFFEYQNITFSTGVCPNHHPSIIHQSSITTVLNLLLPPKKKPVVFSSFASKSSWSRNKEILKWVLWASFKPGRDVTFVR